MAHFAQIDENNVVTQVLVVSNDDCGGGDFPHSEAIGIEFLKSLLGQDTNWKQTSYNGNFRVRYAGGGYLYSEEYDAFIAPSPYYDWILNAETLEWEAPILYPNDGKFYTWSTIGSDWVETE